MINNKYQYEDDAKRKTNTGSEINNLLDKWVPICDRNSSLKDRITELRRLLQSDDVYLEDILGQIENDQQSPSYKEHKSTNIYEKDLLRNNKLKITVDNYTEMINSENLESLLPSARQNENKSTNTDNKDQN